VKRLRVGVIGLGVGRRHAEAVSANPDCRLVAICDQDPERLAEVGRQFPGVRMEKRDVNVLDDSDIDLVCLASYDNDHYDQTMRAIQQGKHVFVEKPFVLHEQEARAVRDELTKHREVRLSSNLILRRSPRFLDLRRRIACGELGRLYHLEGDYNYGRIQKITEGWRGNLDFYSAVHGGGVHVADLLMWLSGDRIVEVSAVGNAIATEGLGFRNFDNVAAVLRFTDGAVGKLGVNFGCMFPHFHPISIYGTRATFINGLDCAWLYTSRDPQIMPTRLETAYPGAHKGELIASFVRAVLGQGESDVTEEDVFASLSVCFAIERSVHSGSPVKVDYV